jgi:glutathione S-transferase
MLELYHHGTSVCAAKPRLVLHEKNIEWEGRYIDILAGEQFTPEYLALNPKGVVPTLVHGGNVIRESTLICEYLDAVFSGAPLTPADALEVYAMRGWTKRLDEELHLNTGLVTFAISHRHGVLANAPEVVDNYVNAMGPEAAEGRRRRLSQDIDAAGPRASLLVMDRFLGDMEAVLAERTWLAGGGFSLADIGVIPYVNRLDMLQLSGMWTEARPRLADWFERVKARASFQPAMFGFVPEPLGAIMRDKGEEAWPKVEAILAGA